MEAGCPAALVRTTAELLAMPKLRERDMLLETTLPGTEAPVTLVNAGFVASQDGPALQRPIPALGEHTDEVLHELGYDTSEIARLHEQGAV